MISFITNTIDNPWTDEDVHNYEQYGSQRDTVQYNSYYNWRIKLTDKNTFLCSLKTNDNDYKNIYLFAVTRRLFYFAIFIPQLEVIKQWSKNEQDQKFVAALPLTSKCLSSSNKELNLDDEIMFLDGSCLLVKVNAPVDGFLFPRNKSITNNVIKKQYALLNNLYFQFEREFDGLERMIDAYNAKVGVHNAKIREYNEKLERRRKELNEKLKKMLVRKGIRTGISLTLAGLTGVTLYQFTENLALDFTTASNVSIIVAICPIFTALTSQIFLKEKHLTLNFCLGFSYVSPMTKGIVSQFFSFTK